MRNVLESNYSIRVLHPFMRRVANGMRGERKAREDKEKKSMVCRDRKALCQDICYCFADLSCAWLSHMNKLCISQEGWKGYFVIATNVSAVHCVLQRQPAFPCLLRSLYYPSMPWSFRDRIIFFAVNRNYLSHNQISASKHSNWVVGFKNISHRGCFLRSSKLIYGGRYISRGFFKQLYWKGWSRYQGIIFCTPIQLVSQPGLLVNWNLERSSLPMCELFSSAFLSSSQTCIGDECKVIGSVIELTWLVRWKST